VGSSRRNVRGTRLGRFARGWRPDRNPLRRTSDRVETAALAVLVIAFLAAAPFVAQASAGWARAAAQQAQIAQEASWHQVPAVVLKTDSRVQGGGGWAALQVQAQARWRAPDGKVVTGQIPVSPGTAVGATVRVWTTGDGQLSEPPMGDSQVAGTAGFASALSVTALAVLLVITGTLARWALDKRRMASWDAEWRATEPRWTTRACVFLRPDEEIAADIRQVVDEILAAEPGEAEVSVRNGIVTLGGTLDPKAGPHGDLIPVAIRLMWDVDGVVDIINKLGEPPAAAAEAAQAAEATQAAFHGR
jgi:hypothetical protein